MTDTPQPAARSKPRRRRSFAPRYPAWLAAPSLVYYLVFFLGPMAILVAFSLATQTGFTSLTYGFNTAQYHQITNSFYLSIFERTMVMAGLGSLLTCLVGYPVAYWMARYLSDLQAARAPDHGRAVLDVVSDSDIRPQDRARPQRLRRPGSSASTSSTPSTRSVSGWSTTTCRCSSCRCSHRSSGWTGR